MADAPEGESAHCASGKPYLNKPLCPNTRVSSRAEIKLAISGEEFADRLGKPIIGYSKDGRQFPKIGLADSQKSRHDALTIHVTNLTNYRSQLLIVTFNPKQQINLCPELFPL